MSETIIVGFAGRMCAGKTTAAGYLKQYLEHLDKKVEIFSFATELKNFATILGWNGKKDERGRRCLQLLGTEVGRKCIHEDLWVSKFLARVFVNQHLDVIIVDDIRFRNEVDIIHSLGGFVYYIDREEAQQHKNIDPIEYLRQHQETKSWNELLWDLIFKMPHESETLDSANLPTIRNTGSLSLLSDYVQSMVLTPLVQRMH